jgi:amino acid adenylation domain-containing protein
MKKLLRDIKDNNILLEIVDGQLKVFARDANQSPALIAEIKERKAELIHFLSANNANDPEEFSKLNIPVIPVNADYPVSPSQRRLWVLSQLEGENSAYNLWGAHVFEGSLDHAALSDSFNSLIERHESLRTVFKLNEQGELRQLILPVQETGFAIYCHDLRNEKDQEQKLNEFAYREISKVFDLASGPLLRAGLYRVKDNKWVFVHTQHHIISDAWSAGVLLNELLMLYNAYTKGEPNPLNPLAIQYKDYAAWQDDQLSGELLLEHKQYWLKQFEGELPVLDLPGDRSRPAIKTYNGAAITRQINPDLNNGIRALSTKGGATVFMGLLGVVNTLLYRYTGQEDIVIGSSIASREHRDLENQIGFYVNTLALRMLFSGTGNYGELLDQIKKITLGAYAHQSYPFDELVNDLDLHRDKSRHPLFDVMVVLQTTSGKIENTSQRLGNINVSRYDEVEYVISKFDLTFFFTDTGNELFVRFVYNKDIYTADTIGRLANHLEQLMSAIIENPSVPLAQLDYLGLGEKKQLSESLNTSFVKHPVKKTVVSLFEEQVERTPDSIALVFEDRECTYRELDEQANRLANYLRKNCDIKANDLVGIMLDRSEKMIVAMLGIMKSGGAYVAIEPDNPKARKEFIIKDTHIKSLITQTEYLFGLEYFEGDVFAIDIQLDGLGELGEKLPAPGSDDLAYVIYTSGSTGQPKGVMISHGSVVDYYYGIMQRTNIGDCKRFGLVSTISADLGNTVIYTSLLNGGALYVFSARDVMDGAAMMKTDLDCLKIVPSHWKSLQKENSLFAPVKCLVFGGETLTKDILEYIKLHNGTCEIYNHYGPSETTIGKLIKKIDLHGGEQKISLGTPFGNTSVYVLDAHNGLLPEGIVGEICISGSGLAKGYLNNPGLTAEKFVSNPFRPGELMYRTGDAGRWSGGEIEFIGRKDNQVKIRGYRVELGEIEHALQNHPFIDSAVVLAKANRKEEMELVAYVAGKEQLNKSDLQTYAGKLLPAHMLPVHYVQLDQLPLTSNGKIDRKKLPDPEASGLLSGVTYIAPRNEVEAKLVLLWQEILGREKIGVKDNFFDVGGHSLRATRLVSLIHKTFEVNVGLKELFETVILEDQALMIALAQKAAFKPISPAPATSSGYPLSSSQYRLWILSQFEEGNIAYNVPAAYVFEGYMDRSALEFSFNTLIERHEILRTVFRKNEEAEIRQFILSREETGFSIDFRDLRNQERPEEEARDIVGSAFIKPFDLVSGPLIRVSLLQTAADKWIIAYTMHHIISDGWSKSILIKELLLFYNAYIKGEPDPLKPLRIHYKDYAVWQREQLTGEIPGKHKAYWLKQFEGELPEPGLLADHPRHAIKTYRGKAINRMFSTELSSKLKELTNRHNSTLFMGLLAGINVLLHRYTGQQDVIIGSLIAGRQHADLEDQIGFYINTLALRTRFNGEDNYLDILDKVRQVTINAYEHQAYPFDELINDLQRDMSHSPLFDASVVLQNVEPATSGQEKPGGLTVSDYQGRTTIASRFDLLFDFVEHGDQLQAGLVYNTHIYSDNTAEQLLHHLEQLIVTILQSPSVPVSRLDYLSITEKEQLVKGFNNTLVEYPSNKSIVDLFEEQVLLTPEKTALVSGQTMLTYRELDERSDRLGSYLKETYKTGAGDLIAILLDRSERLLVAIVAILKTGAAYVPIDPAYPVARKEFILQDIRAKVLITEGNFNAGLENYEGHVLDMDFESVMTAGTDVLAKKDIRSTDLAYVMFTSGSTGKPKGVMVTHKGVVRLVRPCNYVQLTGEDVLLSTGAVSFDATTFEYWSMLLSGGKLVLCSRETLLDEQQLGETIRENKVNIMWFTAGWFNQLVDKASGIFEGLKTVIAGGDKLSPAHINAVMDRYPAMKIINGYGPTENTTFSLTWEVIKGAPVYIGKPINNSKAYILDDHLQLCPAGVTGEICVGGDGLALGYLNNKELTAEKFIGNPFSEGERMYKTGDRGRWSADGNIEFTGRIDNQVKINGYRVELEEIENTLQCYPGIDTAVVIVKRGPEGDKELLAYFTCSEPIDVKDLQHALRKTLPAFMLPARYVHLDEIPLTSNGKVDRMGLPDPEGNELSVEKDYVPARNETEEKLVLLWQEVLGGGKVGVKDSFFEIGGHSLRATRLVSLIHKTFEVNIGLKEIFDTVVLEDQAKLIAQARKNSFISISPAALSSSGYVLSSSQFRLWILSQFEEVNIAYNVRNVFVFNGALDRNALEFAFNILIERHEILRTVFRENEYGELRQFILSPGDLGFRITYRDIRDEPVKDQLAEELVREIFMKPFDLASGPLLSAGLVQLEESKWIFTYVVHHIINDAWSRNVFVNEMFLLYDAYVEGKQNPLQPLRIQYKDYAAWQQEQLKSQALQDHKAFWLKQFEGDLPVMEIESDKIRPAVKTYNGKAVRRTFGKKISNDIKILGDQHDATSFMGLLAAVNILLYRYTGQEDIIIGTPIAGREHIDLEDQVGFYVNTLALRTRFEGKDSYLELLEKVKQVALGAYEHQAYPFDNLVKDLDVHHDRSRNPLFDVQVIVQNTAINNKTTGKGPVRPELSGYDKIGTLTCVFDLVFDFLETSDGLNLRIAYNSDIFSDWVITQLADHMEQLLEAIAASPDISVNQLNFLNEEEKRRLLIEFNDNAAEWDNDKTIINLFEDQAQKNPQALAVVFEDTSLTYGELNERANQLAHCLKSVYGVRPGNLIAIMLDRSEKAIIAMLGIMKSGGAYVPVEPGFPKSRKEFIFRDTQTRLVITQTSYLLSLDHYEGQTFAMDIQPEGFATLVENPAPACSHDLAYVIYTSGSTGQPKGVMIEHGGLANTIQSSQLALAIQPEGRNLQLSSFCFDASVFEIFMTLAHGACLYIADEQIQKNPLQLEEYIMKNKIDWACITPAYLRVLDPEKIQTLKKLVTAGESAVAHKARLFLEHGDYYNAYGPTEASICASIFGLKQGEKIKNGNIPIGTPIANAKIYITDGQSRLVPTGVTGEINIGGAGLARGYLNNTGLTAEKFVINPFSPGERMYKTGDLGRWLPNGNIEFTGRKDSQVKIHGYRIELGEIENALKNYRGITTAVAIAKPNTNDQKEIVAYLVSEEKVEPSAIRSWLSNTLPDYMLPSYYVQLDQLPLTVNGKVDSKKLPDPLGSGIQEGLNYLAARNETEEILVKIWQEVLGHRKIGIRDDFFELGGDSLKAMVILKKIINTTGSSVSIKLLFEKKTIENISGYIDGLHGTNDPATGRNTVKYEFLTDPSFNQLAYFSEWNRSGDDIIMMTCEIDSIDVKSFAHAFHQLVRRHEILRTVFVRLNGEIKQKILCADEITIEIPEPVAVASDGQLAEIIAAGYHRTFDLFGAPLFSVNLYKPENRDHVIVITLHHIITDAYSSGIIKNELMQLYAEAVKGTVSALRPLDFQYRDFSSWQRNFVSSPEGIKHKAYWMEKLKGVNPGLTLSFSPGSVYAGDEDATSLVLICDGKMHEEIDQFIKEKGLTRAVLLMGVLTLVLHQLSGRCDIVLCTTVSGRNSKHYRELDVTGLIGFFPNLLLVRNVIDRKMTIADYLKQLRDNFLDDLEHEAYPFEKLICELTTRTSDFLNSAVFYNYHNYSYNRELVYKTENPETGKRTEKDDTSQLGFGLVVTEFKNCLKLKFMFNADLFPYANRVEARDHYMSVLSQVLHNPELAINHITECDLTAVNL